MHIRFDRPNGRIKRRLLLLVLLLLLQLRHHRRRGGAGRQEQAGADATQNAKDRVRCQRECRIDFFEYIEEGCGEQPNTCPGDHREDKDLLFIRRHQLIHAGQEHGLGTGHTRLGYGGNDHPQRDL